MKAHWNEMGQICTKCLMPSSYPGVKYDNEGVCNLCREYKPKKLLGESALIRKIESKKADKYNCILGISGGKDSCYVAYLAQKRFRLKSLAVCYDFCFLRDLARKNAKINGATKAAVTKLDCMFPECRSAQKFEDLSKDAKQFIKEVENRTGIPVVLIGTGPEALDIIDRR